MGCGDPCARCNEKWQRQANRPRIGLFGGAFDPPQMGHVMVAAYALATARLDLLWVVPCWGHGFDKKMSPFEDRCAMARAAFEPVFGGRVLVQDVEALWKTKYTVDLVERLRERMPEAEIVLIIGWDEFKALGRWHRADDLTKMVEVFPVRRGKYNPDLTPYQFSVPDVSSTFVRHDIASFGVVGKGRVGELIPSGVAEYIERRGLYR